jgi:hypothetical protein
MFAKCVLSSSLMRPILPAYGAAHARVVRRALETAIARCRLNFRDWRWCSEVTAPLLRAPRQRPPYDMLGHRRTS